MTVSYKVTEVNFDIGFIGVEIDHGNGAISNIDVDLYSIATSSEDTELMLKFALDQIVMAKHNQAFPPVRPTPQAANGMIGQTFTVA